jgi:deoxyribose-phosphate aldolase
MNLTVEQAASMIDHTNLHAYATEEDFKNLCREAAEFGFKSVAINTYPVKLCRELLKGTSVLTGAAVAFPLGQMTINSKVDEASNAIADGCQEFDYVLNIGRAKDHDFDYIYREMSEMVSLARHHNICCKVIFETCYLTEDEIIELAKIASTVKPDFVKTSTGFGTAGATARHVELMKKYVGPDVQVKAAGGIRSYAAFKEMVEAGATRIGTSSGVKIIEEMRALIR